MKKILGSLLLLTLSLFAKSAYEWKIELADKELYVHQSTVLTMQCTFSKEGKNDDVEFTPPKDIPFEFELLSEHRHFEGERQILVYKYLLFSKEAGSYELRLTPKMLFTTQSAIDNVIIGRDNVNDLEVQKETAVIEPISITVDETASGLTGRLALNADIDMREASAYEPVHLELSFEGEGNLHELKPIVFEIEDVEVFSDKPEQQITLSENGYKGKWIQRFAFVGKNDFVIPSVSLAYFDLQTKERRVLKTDAFAIQIKGDGIKRKDLIDKVDIPSEKIDFTAYLGYLYYLLTFIAGFVVAKLLRLPQKTVKRERCTKIKEAGSAKELLDALVVCEKDLFASEIAQLESAVYKNETLSLSDIKKKAVSKL
jgi:hypothetical protein